MRLPVLLLVLPAFLALLSCADSRQLKQQAPEVKFLIGFAGTPARVELDAAVSAAGCSLGDFLSVDAGIATAKCPAGVRLSTSTPGFTGLGVNLVAQDVHFTLSEDTQSAIAEPLTSQRRTSASAGTTTTGSATTNGFYTGPITGEPNDPLWAYQWAPRSIEAPKAWAQGINGRCVRVGVVDGYFGTLNPDIKNKFDTNVSKSFADISFETDPVGGVPHGQWVSGVIGAEANNGWSVMGVAYGSTLLGVQVFGSSSGAPFSTIVEGILYAAQRKDKGGAGADIINLSLGALGTKNADPGVEPGAGPIIGLLNKAFAFANKNGVLVVAAAGNNYFNLNTPGPFLSTPCEQANVLCVAANGPVGICPVCSSPTSDVDCAFPPGLDFQNANYSRLASYTNFGLTVDVTAPGGDIMLRGIRPCWGDDKVVTTGPVDVTNWVAGTSFSAPHVSALAALYIQKAAMDKGVLESELCSPGRTKTFISPGQVKRAILSGAVLPPGKVGDMKKLFGAGIINVPRTLGL
ncbi:hypothetical protein HYH03_015961 [Edaphochlamys debaryana]|uniref:Peptidase S8/S53 domain-containing protein n=1 Tax=Edaphochlamys debaryana TaxID=47281 RepID=A0A835XN76_9CHLO|nr:hypothetical protein HYH03_015961 [Edaphochlamys debaryana]|eukprot:KAG2485286.1 hypothetical protein HYH03_015961 [Edaphochlamys debaryana]